jgi:hypothetical protein
MPNSADEVNRRDFELQLIAKAFQDPAFKQELIRNPRAVIAKEFSIQLPAGIEIRVLEETEKVLYIVLPYMAEQCPRKKRDNNQKSTQT